MFSHLLSKLPESRLADWRIGRVSVCIAILGSYGPGGGQRLVCVTDNRIAFGDFSGEHGALKAEGLVSGWGVMFAGNDVDKAPAIIRDTRKKLYAVIAKGKTRLEPEDVAHALDESYSEQLQLHIENKILRKHGFDGESFLKNGKMKCTPEVYAKVWDKVDKERFSLKFIVYGFAKNQLSLEQGYIWLVNGEEAPTSYDSIGFWSIGKGANSALSTIAFHLSRDRHLTSSIENTVYVALAAKFMAESASDVGPSTFAVILAPPPEGSRGNFPTPVLLTQPEIDKIRNLWEKDGIPRISNSTSSAVREIIDTSAKKMAARVDRQRNTDPREPKP